MPSFLAILILFATAIVAVTGQCDFCSGGIDTPDKEVGGTLCSDVAETLGDSPACDIADFYEFSCCPSAKNTTCSSCPDGGGINDPDTEFVTSNSLTVTCGQGEEM
eukprot:scaffold7412_cov115-Cylindrotheca_fusiformis.AAC.6